MTERLKHPVRYRLEAIVFKAVLWILRRLPLDAASAVVGVIFRTIGPLLRVSDRARGNLKRAFPEKLPHEINHTVKAMWEHLGRVVAEYAHLEELRCFRDGGRVEVINPDILTAARDTGLGSIVVTGHFGNWEAQGFCAADQGVKASTVYRTANNPLVDRELQRLRSVIVDAQFPKGAGGARKILKYLKSGGMVAMLMDQKMNDGVPVPFFGEDAMTPPAAAELAYKYGYPLIPLRSERLTGSRFRITVHPPINVLRSGDREADVRAALVEINALLEDWIRERPEQWLWLHNRWPET